MILPVNLQGFTSNVLSNTNSKNSNLWKEFQKSMLHSFPSSIFQGFVQGFFRKHLLRFIIEFFLGCSRNLFIDCFFNDCFWNCYLIFSENSFKIPRNFLQQLPARIPSKIHFRITFKDYVAWSYIAQIWTISR